MHVALQFFNKTRNYILSNAALRLSFDNFRQSKENLRLYMVANEDKELTIKDTLVARKIDPLSLNEMIQRLSHNP